MMIHGSTSRNNKNPTTLRRHHQQRAALSPRRAALRVVLGKAAVVAAVLVVGSVSAFSVSETRSVPSIERGTEDPTTTTTTHHCWIQRFETRSRSPPRFDGFSESLIGKWVIDNIPTTHTNDVGNVVVNGNDNDDDDANVNANVNASTVLVADVEEVMRSCGGAVQGIREPASNSNSGNDNGGQGDGKRETHQSSSSTYLNRANDGFVFFDDGCYTMGPLSIQQEQEQPNSTEEDDESTEKNDNDDDNDVFLSCLLLPETDPEGRTQRLVFGFGGSGFQLLPHTTTMRTKQRFGDDNDNENQTHNRQTPPKKNNPAEQEEQPPAFVAIDEIKRVVRCRMPGGDEQPWMLQRAKWETLLPVAPKENNDDSDDEDIKTKEGTDPQCSKDDDVEPLVHFWVASEPALDFYERLGIPMSVMRDRSSSCESMEGIVVQCGVACQRTKTLRLVAREYKSNSRGTERPTTATLCGILRVEGKARFV